MSNPKENNQVNQKELVTYYMALSHKDWELPNSRIWLAEMDIDRGLYFPSSNSFIKLKQRKS